MSLIDNRAFSFYAYEKAFIRQTLLKVSINKLKESGLVTLNWTVFKRTVTIENQEKR